MLGVPSGKGRHSYAVWLLHFSLVFLSCLFYLFFLVTSLCYHLGQQVSQGQASPLLTLHEALAFEPEKNECSPSAQHLQGSVWMGGWVTESGIDLYMSFLELP